MVYRSMDSVARAGDYQASVIARVGKVADVMLLAQELQDLPTDYLAVANTENRAEFERVVPEMKAAIEALKDTALTPEELQTWMQYERAVVTVIEAGAVILALENPVGHMLGPTLMEKLDAFSTEMRKLSAEARKRAESEAASAASSAALAKTAGTRTALIAAVLTVLSSFLITLQLSRSITGPLADLTRQVAGLAAGGGDLTRELHVRTADELGTLTRTFNTFLGTLRNLIHEVQVTSGV